MLYFPVGAMCAGILAASGYYLGSIFLHQKPTKMILLNMLIISLGTYFLIQYLNYLYLTMDGIKIFDMSTFWEYWDIVMLNTTVSRAGSSKATFELGVFGYGFAFLQIIGFSMGGIVSYIHLSSRLYCEKCSRYFAQKETVSKYGEDSDTLRETWAKIAEMLMGKRFEEAISSYSLEGGSSKFDKKKHHLQSRIIAQTIQYTQLYVFPQFNTQWDGAYCLATHTVNGTHLNKFSLCP